MGLDDSKCILCRSSAAVTCSTASQDVGLSRGFRSIPPVITDDFRGTIVVGSLFGTSPTRINYDIGFYMPVL